MCYLRLFVFSMMAFVLSGCYFQSHSILSDPTAGGDQIKGLGTNAPVRFTILNSENGQPEDTGYFTPKATADGKIQYLITLLDASGQPTSDDNGFILAQALSEDRYLVRYIQFKDRDPKAIDTTALLFLSVKGDEYDWLMEVQQPNLLDKIFPNGFASIDSPITENPARFNLTTMKQIDLISKYFDSHTSEFNEKEYARMQLK